MFDFKTDEESYLYFKEILQVIVDSHSLTEEEGIKLMNKHLKGMNLTQSGADEIMLYREEPELWADLFVNGTDETWYAMREGKLP